MLGGRSSSKENKMITGRVSNLVKIGEENDSKCSQKVKSEGLMLTASM
jgi:hypothetical protein